MLQFFGLTRFSGLPPAQPMARQKPAPYFAGRYQEDSFEKSGHSAGKVTRVVLLGGGALMAGALAFVGVSQGVPLLTHGNTSASASTDPTSKAPVKGKSDEVQPLTMTDNSGKVLATMTADGVVIGRDGKKLGSVTVKPIKDSELSAKNADGNPVDFGEVYIARDAKGHKIAWGLQNGVVIVHRPAEEVKKANGEKRDWKCVWVCHKPKPDTPMGTAEENESSAYLTATLDASGNPTVDLRLLKKDEAKKSTAVQLSEATTFDAGDIQNTDGVDKGQQAVFAVLVAHATTTNSQGYSVVLPTRLPEGDKYHDRKIDW